MKDNIILEKYTRALFEVAEEKRVTEKVAAELEKLDAAFQALPELSEYLTSPQVEWKEKKAIAGTLTKGMSEILSNFINLVVEKERQEILPEVPQQFKRLLELQKRKTKATVYTAVPLKDDVRKLLENKLNELFQGEVELSAEVDPDIIGGLKVQVGYTVIDGTIQRQLREMGRAMARG